MKEKTTNHKISARLGVLSDLFSYLWQRKLWWLIPMMVIMIFVVGLLIFAQGSPLAPFIYSLF